MVEANLIGEIPHIIKNLPGVISFLSLTKGGDPVPMRKSEVNRMLGKMDELSEFATEMEIPFVVGESVKVMTTNDTKQKEVTTQENMRKHMKFI